VVDRDFEEALNLSGVQIKRQDPKTKKYNNVKMDKDRMPMLVEPEDIIEVKPKMILPFVGSVMAIALGAVRH